ncbi:MAG: D-alanine--D-alanine ligase [Bacteroidetes bacterium]|nr:D-alanine--D-alanine ligase [Bacteroidota bacterium]
MNKFQLTFYKITHWEYWPYAWVYYPIYFVWFYYTVKARTLFFFNAANPSIKNGGMAMESKKEIYDIMPMGSYPKTMVVKPEGDFGGISKQMHDAEMQFPCIAKPDTGMKAYAVEKIANEQELEKYHHKMPFDYLVQEFIPFENEIGIFYIRMPDEENGIISGIVSKEFLSVTGTGLHSILQLIQLNPRYQLQEEVLQKQYGSYLQTILPKDEKFILVPYGSHTRGSKFTDISYQSNPQLVQTINSICTQIQGFYFGRLDIRYANFDELSIGKNFSIIEVNGAGSEPTHIYDPKHSLLFAWKEIIRHWKLLYKISAMNHAKGYPYLNYKQGMEMIKANAERGEVLKGI